MMKHIINEYPDSHLEQDTQNFLRKFKTATTRRDFVASNTKILECIVYVQYISICTVRAGLIASYKFTRVNRKDVTFAKLLYYYPVS